MGILTYTRLNGPRNRWLSKRESRCSLYQFHLNCNFLSYTAEHYSIKVDDAGQAVHKQGETSYQMQSYLPAQLITFVQFLQTWLIY